MKRFLLGVVLLFAGVELAAETGSGAARPERPVPAIERVLIVSIDGLRPDCALLANTPTLHALVREGAYTFWARTTAVSITLPSHTSMLTGVIPRKHGIEWNRDLPLTAPIYPRVPTIFELATRAGYTTAMVTAKTKFSTLNRPGTISYVHLPTTGRNPDDEAMRAAREIIAAHRPELMFVHFGGVDVAGHHEGWGSPAQRAAIEKVDAQLALVLSALDETGLRKSTLIIVSADHGGAGLTHGADDPRSRHIPWIAVGPGIKPGFDLTQIEKVQVNTEDTAATACYVLGLERPANFDGQPVLAAFENTP